MDLELMELAVKRNTSAILQPFDIIFDAGGFESICALSECFGGSTVYIPGTKVIFKRCIENEAMKDFKKNGSYREIMKKYGMSETYWRKVVNNR